MVILSAKQIHDWDQFTIQHRPIASIDLMETAATQCLYWLQQRNFLSGRFHVFCGKGNNGGDGLALARMLWMKGCSVTAHILELGQKGTEDFQTNLARLHNTGTGIQYIQSADRFPSIPAGDIIIDALFGTGLNRKLEGLAAKLVQSINALPNPVIAIDMPSGLLADNSSRGFDVIQATHTLSFQCMKFCFMMAENESFAGEVHILDIGLLPAYLSTISYDTIITDTTLARAVYKPRKRFAHKGTYGHAAMIAGSYGYMGAAVLSAQGCLRSGVGKLTCHIPSCGYDIMQISVPEAMSKAEDGTTHIVTVSDPSKYNAVGIGPGIGLYESHAAMLDNLFDTIKRPMVIDADALNVLSSNIDLLKKVPQFSILTPHPTEFDRLFGKSDDDFARMRKATEQSRQLQLIIVLKGHKTFIAMPGGINYFNNTGNPGMATGGSGDVLTGMLTGLLAQGYAPEQAALLGVYLHGLAGDHAAAMFTEEAMIASDIIQCLSSAFGVLKN